MCGPKARPLIDRFNEKWIPVPECGCWFWTGTWLYRQGYGQLSLQHRKPQITAHRLSWILHYGDIPEGMSVLHKCDTPCCVNPNHLFLGTCKDNIHDMIRKNRQKMEFNTVHRG